MALPPATATSLRPGQHDWRGAGTALVDAGSGGGAFHFDRLTLGFVLTPLKSHVARYGDTRSRDVPVLAGNGWILPAGVDGECRWEGNTRFLNVELAAAVLQQVAPCGTLPAFDAVYAFHDPLAQQMAMQLHALGAMSEAALGVYRDQLTLALTSHVLHQVATAPEPTRALPDARLMKAVELMQAKLAAPLTLDDLAAAATLSPFHFAKAFKAAYGSAPHQYLTQLRIEKAQTLLKQTAMPVGDIVEAVGYSNASHFTAAFRKATGVTPAAYRKG
ncbi:MAG: helix-turn-helix domain-containing protein [Silanimonas sp.]